MTDENTPKDEQKADRKLLDDARRQVEEVRQRAEATATSPQTARIEAPGAGFVVPARLGSVRLVREIGRGGMGVVHLGWDELLERNVAVKFLLNAISGPDDPDFAQFLKGARAAAAVKHPGLTTTYHADLVENVPYLVLEYVDGPTLRQVVKQTGPLSVAATLAVMDAVSSAIGALHSQGIIHRDIKPSNVLLDRHGKVFVTDFGLASARPLGTTRATITGVAGTLAYMAPELFEGVVSPHADVYALGIMLFELLSGRLPFSGDLAAIRDQHASAPMPVAELPNSTPAALVEIIERAAHKKGMFRYKSAENLQRVLRESVATDELLREGAAELKKLAHNLRLKKPAEQPVEKSEAPSTTTLYEHLSVIADGKRAKRQETTEPLEGFRGHAQDEDGDSQPDDELPRAVSVSSKRAQFASRRHAYLALFSVIAAIAGLTVLFVYVPFRFLNFGIWPIFMVTFAVLNVGILRSMRPYFRELSLMAPDKEQEALWKQATSDLSDPASSLWSWPAALLMSCMLVTIAGVFGIVEHWYSTILTVLGDNRTLVALIEAFLICGLTAASVYGSVWFTRRKLEHKIRAELHDLGIPVCWSCGYDLRGLVREGACPECGRTYFYGMCPNCDGRGFTTRPTLFSRAVMKTCSACDGGGKRRTKRDDLAVRAKSELLSGAELAQATRNLVVYEDALAQAERAYGDDHPHVVNSLTNLADCLKSLGRSAEALPKFEAALAMCQRLYEGDDAKLAQNLSGVAACLQSLGRLNEALPKYEAALAMRRRLLPPEHIDVMGLQVALGTALMELQRYEEAEPLLVGTATQLLERIGGPLSERQRTLQALVELFVIKDAAEPGKGYAEKAAEWRQMLPDVPDA